MFKTLRRLAHVCYPFRWVVAVLGLLILLEQSIALAIPYVQGMIVDALIGHRPFGHLVFLASIICALLAVDNVFGTIRWMYDLKRFSQPLSRAVLRMTMERLTMLSIGQHVSENSGITRSKINKGQQALQNLVRMAVFEISPMIIELTVVIVALLAMNILLGLIFCLGAITFAVWAYLMNRPMHAKMLALEKIWNRESRFQGEVLRNMELVLATAQETKAVRECDDRRGGAYAYHQKIWTPYAIRASWRDMILVLTRYGILAVGAYLVINGHCTAGIMVTFWSWSASALNRVNGIGRIYREIIGDLASLDNYLAILDMETDTPSVAHPIRPERFAGEIVFEHVTLRYQRRDEHDDETEDVNKEMEASPASLEDVSFTIKAGSRIAFVGESGAGKSTIVYALLRAQDPESGRILVDGNDIRTLHLQHFREHIGLVSQMTFLFDDTIEYNITYALNGETASTISEKLNNAARMARLDGFISKLAKGYATRIGESGVKLSGGERQRLGIARALIKDPHMFVFDEATSSLDPKNEEGIRQEIEEISKGRTTIIVAHRYSTIRNVDKIFVMDQGHLVGQGKHEELMTTCPHYRELVEHQRFI